MYKRWYFGIALLCFACFLLSLIWMIAPQTLGENSPYYTTQTSSTYLLCDAGGYVQIIAVSANNTSSTGTKTDILVNLLPEQDAVRIKTGKLLVDDATLAQTLASLRHAQQR